MNKYEKQWELATFPKLTTLQGKWRVRIVLGWLLPLHIIDRWWYKRIKSDRNAYNIIFGKPCLAFNIVGSPGSYYDKRIAKSKEFCYDHFTEFVRQINPDKMLGQFWVRDKMLGYFIMERK